MYETAFRAHRKEKCRLGRGEDAERFPLGRKEQTKKKVRSSGSVGDPSFRDISAGTCLPWGLTSMGKLTANHAEGHEAVRTPMTRWVVVGMLNGAMVIAYFNRVNLSMAMTPMSEGFGWLASQQGLALSAFYWTYSPLQIPSGYLVDRFGARAPLAIGVLLWSVASAATSLANTLTALVVIRLLVGISEAVVTPASMRYIRMHFEEKQRGLAIGLYLSGSKFGPALGFVLAAYLVEVLGWRWMFVIFGLGGLVWLPPFLMLMKRDDVAAVRQKDRRIEQQGTQNQIVPLLAILRSPVMWGTFVGSFCYMYFVYYCITWMPAYLKQRHGMSVTEQGWYSGFAFGGDVGSDCPCRLGRGPAHRTRVRSGDGPQVFHYRRFPFGDDADPGRLY